MNDFPLAQFLIGLAADGITVTINDYDRIYFVLKTRGEWNREKLRGVLISLLAHNPEHVKSLKQRFNNCFDENPSDAETFTEVQIQAVIKELETIREIQLNRPKGFNELEQRSLSFDSSLLNKPSITLIESNGAAKSERTSEERNTWSSNLRAILKTVAAHRKALVALNIVAIISALSLYIVPLLIHHQTDVSTNTNSNTNSQTSPQAQLTVTTTGNSNTNSRTPSQAQPTATTTGNSNSKPQPQPSNTPINTQEGNNSGFSPSSYIFITSAVIVASLILLGLFIKLRINREVVPSYVPPAPLFNRDKPSHFPLNKIGGDREPYLDAETLDNLSKSLAYFLSEKPCNRLDTKASVHASGQSGGMYIPHFHKLKNLLNVYILEDAYAEPLAWNSAAKELAVGLRQRGVSVRFGNFYDSLESFQMDDGGTVWFEDLEQYRYESLVLFFSDGQRLTRRRDGFLLESLSHWSSVAWLDLRDKRFWDESAQLIKRYKIPLYQANKNGITRAMQRFFTERGLERDDAAFVTRWQGVPAHTGLVEEYAKDVIGENALAWAQACAMIQPLSLGMADALRRKFAPHLAPEHIERLIRLNEPSWNVSGIYFSPPILSVLHKGFTESWSIQEQEEILRFILEQIKKLEPTDKESLEYLIWEWTFERVHLEVEPDEAIDSLAKLSLTPLGERIKKDFAHLYLPGETVYESAAVKQAKIFLRSCPKTARGLLQFQYLTNRVIGLQRLSFIKWMAIYWYKALNALKEVAAIEVGFSSQFKRAQHRIDADYSLKSPKITAYSSFIEDRVSITTNVLKVRNLQTYFMTEDEEVVAAVDDVSFHLDAGEVLGLVGESGCGKSVTALSIMRLISPPGEIVGGEIWLEGENLLTATQKRIREIRGKNIAMIFQDPANALHPFYTVGEQIAEALRLHQELTRRQAHEAAIEALKEVAIPDPARRVDEYPHQLSGGMCQRVMIAMALVCNPKLLIADEPTTALDLITQAQILDLLNTLKRTRKLSILLITHDLSMVAGFANRICVMYAGRIVEEATAKDLFAFPRHPYTQGLLSTMPNLTMAKVAKSYLPVIEGTVPSLSNLPQGCHFAPRCTSRFERCTREPIPLYEVENRAEVRCFLYENSKGGKINTVDD